MRLQQHKQTTKQFINSLATQQVAAASDRLHMGICLEEYAEKFNRRYNRLLDDPRKRRFARMVRFFVFPVISNPKVFSKIRRYFDDLDKRLTHLSVTIDVVENHKKLYTKKCEQPFVFLTYSMLHTHNEPVSFYMLPSE